jgi:hypothetical protein
MPDPSECYEHQPPCWCVPESEERRPAHGDPGNFPPEPPDPEADTGMIMVSRDDVRAVVRLARMSRHLAEDPATDRLAGLCEVAAVSAPAHPDAIEAVRLAVEDILPALLHDLNDEARERGSVGVETLRNGLRTAGGNAIEAAWPYLREMLAAEAAPQRVVGAPSGPGYEALTRDAGGEVWPSDDRGLPPRTCTCEPGQLDLTGHHHEACPALDDR